MSLWPATGAPAAGERYEVRLPDGKRGAKGTLDEKGWARVEGLDPGECTVSFPDRDKDAWEFVESTESLKEV